MVKYNMGEKCVCSQCDVTWNICMLNVLLLTTWWFMSHGIAMPFQAERKTEVNVWKAVPFQIG